MLSSEDKNAIQQSGEIIRQIEFNDPARHSILRGKLRIIKTENPQNFNFVEVGEWISHGQYSDANQSDRHEFRDNVVYDENGNALSRHIYERHDGQFQMKEDWTSEVVDGRFLQHVKVYENGVLVAEYTKNVLDYLVPKSDPKKRKIPFGTDRGYYSDGKLAFVRNYDNNGELISEVKHAH